MALSASEVETAAQLPSELSHLLGAEISCLAALNPSGHMMTGKQFGCRETLLQSN